MEVTLSRRFWTGFGVNGIPRQDNFRCEIVFVLWFDIVIIYFLLTYFSIYADRSYFVWPFFQPHREPAYLGQPLLDRLVDIFCHVHRKINSLQGNQKSKITLW